MNRQEIIENTKKIVDFLTNISEKITSEHPEIEPTLDVSRHFRRTAYGDDYAFVAFVVPQKDNSNESIFNEHVCLSSFTNDADIDSFVEHVNEMFNNIKNY